MADYQVFDTDRYRRLCCSACGVVYFFPAKWTETAQRDGKSWKCPNGHGQWFGESEFDKLQRERDRLRQRVAEEQDNTAHARGQRDHAERRLSATKGVVTRTKKRIGNGACPCCQRSFQNLANHMKTKHPTYAGSNAESMH